MAVNAANGQQYAVWIPMNCAPIKKIGLLFGATVRSWHKVYSSAQLVHLGGEFTRSYGLGFGSMFTVTVDPVHSS
jgi:hypothetical protein